ncbi:MAG: nucleoside-triphosphatase [Planctomycetota bacterium]|jgi:nucleoside-triphosphatase
MGNTILLTGSPGCGKTTAVMRILECLQTVKTTGFFTQEIREGTKRVGFAWRSLEGSEGVLAHKETLSQYRVGHYGVNILEFERKVVPILDSKRKDIDLFVVDEIGKMKCFSNKFVEAIRSLLSSEKKLLATVSLRGGGFIKEMKRLEDVKLIEIKRECFNQIVTNVSKMISEDDVG